MVETDLAILKSQAQEIASQIEQLQLKEWEDRIVNDLQRLSGPPLTEKQTQKFADQILEIARLFKIEQNNSYNLMVVKDVLVPPYMIDPHRDPIHLPHKAGITFYDKEYEPQWQETYGKRALIELTISNIGSGSYGVSAGSDRPEIEYEEHSARLKKATLYKDIRAGYFRFFINSSRQVLVKVTWTDDDYFYLASRELTDEVKRAFIEERRIPFRQLGRDDLPWMKAIEKVLQGSSNNITFPPAGNCFWQHRQTLRFPKGQDDYNRLIQIQRAFIQKAIAEGISADQGLYKPIVYL